MIVATGGLLVKENRLELAKTIQAGALAYNSSMNGVSQLSEREREILTLAATGASNKEIAARLGISPFTVKTHLSHIFEKLGVSTRTEAVSLALQSAPAVESAAEPSPASPAPARRRAWLAAGLLGLVGLAVLAFFLVRPFLQPAIPDLPAATEIPRWQAAPELPTALDAPAAAAYESAIYLFGGGGAWRYLPLAARWEALANPPADLSGAQAAVLGGRIYLAGGCAAPGAVWMYLPEEDVWQPAASLPQALCDSALAPADGRLYLFGGWDGQAVSAAVWAYDPAADAWKAAGSLPTALRGASAVPLEGQLLLIGGQDSPAVWQFDPQNASQGQSAWKARADLPQARTRSAAAVLAGQVYLFGGNLKDGSPAPALQYSPAQDRWSPVEAPAGLEGGTPGLAAVETDLHLLGGLSGGQPSSSHFVSRAVYTILVPLIP